MSDITPVELVTQLALSDIASYWTNAGDLPTGVGFTEFMLKTLDGAYKLAQQKNTTLTAGSRIASYSAPVATTPTLNTGGLFTYRLSYTVTGLVTVDLNTISSVTS